MKKMAIERIKSVTKTVKEWIEQLREEASSLPVEVLVWEDASRPIAWVDVGGQVFKVTETGIRYVSSRYEFEYKF